MTWLRTGLRDAEAGYSQVVAWPGTLVREDEEQALADFLVETFGLTQPPRIIGEVPTNHGERVDALFIIHDADITRFAVPRFEWGMRWLEDVLGNDRRRGITTYTPRTMSEYPPQWRFEDDEVGA